MKNQSELNIFGNTECEIGGEGGRTYVLSKGQGFGISPTMKKEYHQAYFIILEYDIPPHWQLQPDTVPGVKVTDAKLERRLPEAALSKGGPVANR